MRYGLDILQQFGKKANIKSQKVLGITGGVEIGMGAFCFPFPILNRVN